jgi:hypothetical protein
VRAARQVAKPEGKTHRHRFSLALLPGKNTLEVHAATGDGSQESKPVAWE